MEFIILNLNLLIKESKDSLFFTFIFILNKFKFLKEKILIYYFLLKYNSIEFINIKKFYKKLFLYFFIKKNIKVKIGIDLNKKDIHLGHIFLFHNLKKFHLLKFKIIIILGIITSKLVDPSYKLLNISNFKNIYIFFFIKQIKIFFISKILEIYFNNEWINLINILDLSKILYILNLSKILKRKDFILKLKKNINIKFSEIIYIFFQSYDSIFIKSLFELGGLDQKLNFIITNLFQLKFINFSQILILYPLILNSKKKKLSKMNKILTLNEKKLLIFKNVIKLKILNFYFKLFFKTIKIKNNFFLKFLFFINFIQNKYKISFIDKLFFLKKILKIIFINYNFLKINKLFFKNKKFKSKFILLNNIIIKNNNFLILKNNFKFFNFLIKIY